MTEGRHGTQQTLLDAQRVARSAVTKAIRRLAGAATQQMAHGGQALLLVDDREYGLEPHRLFHLLSRLRDETSFAPVRRTRRRRRRAVRPGGTLGRRVVRLGQVSSGCRLCVRTVGCSVSFGPLLLGVEQW